jgi:hypothetical protein
MRTAALAVAALALLTGCPSVTTMGTARTVPEDSFQMYVAPGAIRLQDFEAGDDTGEPESLTFPGIELGVRYGVTDGVEIGARLGSSTELNAKFQLRRSESASHGVDLALAPSASFFGIGDASMAWLHLAMPIGFNTGGGDQLVVAPRISDTMVFGFDQVGNALWAGGSVGYAWRVGKRGRLRIMPEIGAIFPVATSIGTEASADVAFEGAIVQGQIGFIFGL